QGFKTWVTDRIFTFHRMGALQAEIFIYSDKHSNGELVVLMWGMWGLMAYLLPSLPLIAPP
ncbi:MAG: hypothetical protein LBF22_13650, partial [Deltaproteobacteria bacterium]|nr:hypothetical protein [Deltaproteobacteria bacterium]